MHIPSKAAKHGLKIWKAVDINYYCINAIVFLGKAGSDSGAPRKVFSISFNFRFLGNYGFDWTLIGSGL